MKPSARLILAALRRGEVITPIISLHSFGVHALSQRCTELRNDPTVEEITSERVKGETYHRYYMPTYARVVSTPTTPKATPVRAHVRKTKELTDDCQQELFA